ncbi:MAG: hypothetical protein ACI9QD_000687 [Thermoproteota archaeon]|jgi:hypothetical protein
MSDVKVLNFKEKRDEKIEAKRRNFERVLFQDFLGCYSVIDEYGTNFPVKLVDLSNEGCMFQVPWSKNNEKKFQLDKDITLRVYFTEGSFIPVVVSVKHGKKWTDPSGNVFMRYGGEFDQKLPSFKAMQSFINFIYEYAEFSCVDQGENKVYFL